MKQTKSKYTALLAGLLALVTVGGATAAVITLQPVDDAYLSSSDGEADQTWNTAVLEQFGYYGTVKRPLLKFNLSSIPDGATILSAELTITLQGIYGGQEHSTTVWRIPNDNWSETNVTWNSYAQTGAVVVASLPGTDQVGARVWHIQLADWPYAADLADDAVTFQARWDRDGAGGYETDGYYKWNTYSSKEGTVAPTLRIEYSTNLPSGLISWWRAENNTADETGTHPGSALGGLTYTNGQVGQCFVLDGVAAAVVLGGGWFNLQQFTLSLWVNPGENQMAYADLLDNYHTTSVSWPIQHQNIQEGGYSRWQWGPNGGGVINFDLRIGAWQHLVIARDDTTGTTVYTNGVPAGSTTGYSPIPYDGSEFLYLGRHAIFGRYFKGSVDELMIFNRALTSSDVSSLYASQLSAPKLDIQRQSNSVVVSWPLPADGWVLEATNTLSPTGAPWPQIAPPYQTNGANLEFTEPSPVGHRFYRLHKP